MTLAAVFALATATFPFQDPNAPVLLTDFKEGAGAWTAAGPTGKVSISRDSAITGSSAAALKFDYQIAKGATNLLLLPAGAGSLTKAKSVHFRVRADETTLLALALQEDGGGRYVAMINAPKDTWQTVDLSTSDFDLSMDKDAPKDPDMKLDMDQVSGVFIVDVSQFFAQSDDPGARALLGTRTGPHSLMLEDFTLSPVAVPGFNGNAGDDVLLDTLVHPQLAWFGLGGLNVSKVANSPLTGTVLRADYHQAPALIVGMTRPMSPWILTATKAISFEAASIQPAKLIFQLEDTAGGKYNQTLDVPGGSKPTNFRLNYSDFKVSQDSADPHGTLDITRVKTLVIIDASGLSVTADSPNTLWIGDLRAKGK